MTARFLSKSPNAKMVKVPIEYLVLLNKTAEKNEFWYEF